MQLKLLQAKQEETRSDRIRKKEEKREGERHLSPQLYSPSSPFPLSFFSHRLLKPYCICPPSLAGGKHRAGGQDGRGGEERGTSGSESSAEERNKFINNKGDVTSG